MSIIATQPLDASKNLVRISREEAIDLQWKTIKSWDPQSDVWPFHFGIGALSFSAALSSLYIVGHYRRKLKLRNYARLSMNLPVAGLPAVILPILHQKIVSEAILIQGACPVCIQMRSICLQNAVGVVYPAILASLSGFMYSSTFLTYRLPLFKLENAAELFSIWKNLSRPFARKFSILFIFNTFISAFVTEFEARSFYRIQKQLISDLNK